MKSIRIILFYNFFVLWKRSLKALLLVSLLAAMFLWPSFTETKDSLIEAREANNSGLIELLQNTAAKELYEKWYDITLMFLAYGGFWTIAYERKSGVLTMFFTRIRRSEYVIADILVAATLGLLTLLVGAMAYLILSLYFNSPDYGNIAAAFIYDFSKILMLVSAVYLFGILILFRSVFAFIIAFISALFVTKCCLGQDALLAVISVISLFIPVWLGQSVLELGMSSAGIPWGTYFMLLAENVGFSILCILVSASVIQKLEIPTRA